MSTVTYTGARDGLDWYVEPDWCVHALLGAERFEGLIWDPACGGGTIPKVCAARGHEAVASDIVDRGFPGTAVEDFLDGRPARYIVPNIVCNPPYRRAAEFIRRALILARCKVAVIVQQQFPFSQGRHALFTETPLARLYYLSDRPSMPPGAALAEGEVRASGGSIDYLWMVWEHGHIGPPSAHWLRRPRRGTGELFGPEPPEAAVD